jgi:hypothetical protein
MYELIDAGLSHPLIYGIPAAAAGVSRIVRSWLMHRAIIRHESETTRRLRIAVLDTTAAERAAVVRAYAALEAATRGAGPVETKTGPD